MSHSILENGRVLSAPSLHRESTDSLIVTSELELNLEPRVIIILSAAHIYLQCLTMIHDTQELDDCYTNGKRNK